MFENLVNQEASKLLNSDIKKNLMPGSILFSGAEASGKLTAALETARILSCHAKPQGKWLCECPSCLHHKALTCSNLLLLGPRDCSLEITAAKETFLNAVKNNASYLTATRYLFVRSVRKLSMRFSGILWQGDSNINKIGTIVEEINDNLEKIDIPRTLPAFEELTAICDELVKLSLKLENDYLYDSIPINQIRNMEEWAHIKSEEGKKTVIIENADRMAVSVRNALLKILEEPPADCVFILLTSKRNAIMQTILSRVRTYNFVNRTLEQQKDVITRVFHDDDFTGSINEYLLKYLPVAPETIKEQAKYFYKSIAERQIPDINLIIKKCDNFSPRIELKLFLNYIALEQRKLMYSQCGAEASAKCMEKLRNCWDNITLYNQTPLSSMEILLRDMSALNVQNGGIFNK